MNFDDLKDKVVSEARLIWDKIQDSAAYSQLRDRYENMPPHSQKLSIIGLIFFLSFLILFIPYSHYTASTEHVGEFENKRMTIRELLKVTRESAEVPNIPQAPSLESLRSTIESYIQAANLLPEQIKGTQNLDATSTTIPKNLTEGMIQVSLAKLNLHQILDLGYRFQTISPSVKMKDLVIDANIQDSRYFDVVFKLVALAVPAPMEIPLEPPAPLQNRRNTNNEDGENTENKGDE